MLPPKESYTQNKRITDIDDVAYNRLFENYLKLDLKGNQKLIDIDSTNQEEVLRKRAHATPFPGMIYTFINLNTKNLIELQAAATGKIVQFHDFTPILFCTSFNPRSALIKGINLCMFEGEDRMKFLQVFYEQYESFFKKVEELTEYDKNAINKEYVSDALSGKNSLLFKRFDSKTKELFEFGYRSYDIRSLKKFRMIEYQEWQYVPFYDAKQTFKIHGLNQLYKMYNDIK